MSKAKRAAEGSDWAPLPAEGGKLKTVLVKDATIRMRVTARDKEDMQATAKACGMTLTEYLTRLHWLAVEGLKERR